MRFFFDRCAPIAIAQMVRAIEGTAHVVCHLDEDGRFTATTTDADWMKVLRGDSAPGWIVISGDGRILKNKAERAVLDEGGLRFFCLDKPWPNTPIYEYAWKFMKVWPRILQMASKQNSGRIFKVGAGSSLPIDVLA